MKAVPGVRLLWGMSQPLRSVREYCGTKHAALSGRRVVVVAVYREARRLLEGPELDVLLAGDVVEVAPILSERAGRVRVAWITFGVAGESLSPPRAWFDGVIPDGVLVTR